MASRKILFITSWYPTKENPVGGVFVREHAKAVKLYNNLTLLHLAGFNSEIKGLWSIEEETDENLKESIQTYRVWCRRLPIPKARYLIYLYSVLKSFKYILSQGFRPDIIHAHVYEAGVPAVLIGKIYDIPVVITEHSSAFSRKMLSFKEVFKAKIAFRNAKYVLPVSCALKKAIKSYGIRTNFRIVPNVVDPSVFHPSPEAKKFNNSKRILFVGLLVPIKGIPYLFQALNQLRKNRDDWHLDIVGDGPSRREYEQLATDLELVEKVTFHGIKSKQEVSKFMQQADLFVLPSSVETFGAAAAEALSTGTPVLATRCGGVEEFINDNVGLLVTPNDAEALYNGLDYMLDHLAEFKSVQISRYATEHFSPDRVGERLQRIYLECIENNIGSYGTTIQTRPYQ